MKKSSLMAVMFVMLPAMAGAQLKPLPPTPPTPPAAPMAAPEPMWAPMPPMPPAAPMAPMAPLAPLPAVVIPELADLYTIDAQDVRDRARIASEQARRVMSETRAMNQEQIREIADAARKQAQDMKMSQEDIQRYVERAREQAQMPKPMMANGFDYQTFSSGYSQNYSLAEATERSFYDRGQSALSQRQYEQAVTRFDQAIAAKGTRTDAAMYWKAFAQFKLGHSSDANATLAELEKSYKDSKYMSEAKVLESEIKRVGGQAARPENEDDEDLKLLALQGLVNSDPERAVPLVQGVLASAGSLKLKDRALFVLAQSNSAQAHTILVNTAKGGTPDLQLKAINYLGINRGREGAKTSSAELMDIYNSSQNDDVKRAILRAFGSSGDRAALVNVISGTTVSTMRTEAVNQLGSAQGGTELWTIYQKESNKELKMQILSTLGNMGAYDRIIEVAKTEKEVDLRNRAIRSLGNMRAERSGQALVEIYPTLGEATDAKKAVIQGLANQNNAEGLITIARKESKFELTREIISRLSNMPKNKAAQDYLMEIVKK